MPTIIAIQTSQAHAVVDYLARESAGRLGQALKDTENNQLQTDQATAPVK